jgi:ribosomal subunit interface protein
MKIIIKGIRIKLTQGLKNFIEEKIGGLEKFFKFKVKEDFEIKAFVEIGKLSKHHRRGDVFYAECQILLPKKGVRFAAEKGDLKLAICEVKDGLQDQLKKYRKAEMQKITRGKRRIKKDLKLSRGARFYRKGRILEEGI